MLNEIFVVKSEYQELTNEKKLEGLALLQQWIDSERTKLEVSK